MDKQLARQIGERVRLYRVAAGKTQPVVAGLVGITTDYLYQVERGTKLPTIGVIVDLARVLERSVDALLHAETSSSSRRATGEASDELHRALTLPVTGTSPVALGALRTDIADAWRDWQTSAHRYSRLTRAAPAHCRGRKYVPRALR